MINLLKFFFRNTLNSILSFLDAVLPPLPALVLKSAAPEPAAEPNLSYIGIYPVGSHAAMYIHTPEQEPEAIAELVIHLPPSPTPAIEAIQASLTQVNADVLTLAPSRALVVEALLDEAWQQGLRTYAQLIKYVQLASGQGCSKKTVSAWKKSRKLDQVEAVAA